MDTLYADRARWAVYKSVLEFSIASFTTNRVECTWNMLYAGVCNVHALRIAFTFAGGLFITSLVATKGHSRHIREGKPIYLVSSRKLPSAMTTMKTPAQQLPVPFCCLPVFLLAAMNAQVARFLNAQASLCSVFKFLSGAMEKAAARAELRSAQLSLPSVQHPDVATYWLGDPVLSPCKFALGAWPYKFMVEEATMASVFCSSPMNAVLHGPARLEALGSFEYIGMMVVDVVDVAVIVENHDGTDKRYVVLGMTDGSHLCSCRALQELGLCCRHFWAAMRLSRKFKFHVGILNQHWLAEQGRKPTSEWPEGKKPEWAVATNHKPLEGHELSAPLAAGGGEQCASGDHEGGEGGEGGEEGGG